MKIICTNVLLLVIHICNAQTVEGSFIVTKIERMEAYYVLTTLGVQDSLPRDFFIEMQHPLPDTVKYLEKIVIGNIYFFHLKRMYSFIVSEDKKESIIFPDGPFYIGKRMISNNSYRPFEIVNTVDLFIRKEDSLSPILKRK